MSNWAIHIAYRFARGAFIKVYIFGSSFSEFIIYRKYGKYISFSSIQILLDSISSFSLSMFRDVASDYSEWMFRNCTYLPSAASDFAIHLFDNLINLGFVKKEVSHTSTQIEQYYGFFVVIQSAVCLHVLLSAINVCQSAYGIHSSASKLTTPRWQTVRSSDTCVYSN